MRNKEMPKRIILPKLRQQHGQGLVEGAVGVWFIVIILVMIISAISFTGMYLYVNQMLSFAAQQTAQYVALKLAYQGSNYAASGLSTDAQMVTTKVLKTHFFLATAKATATVDNPAAPDYVTVTTSISGVNVLTGGVLGAMLPPTIQLTQTATAAVEGSGPVFPFTAEILFPGNDPGWVNFGHTGGGIMVPCYAYNKTSKSVAGSSPAGQPVVTMDYTQWMWQPDSGVWEHATKAYSP
jgi:hypothetical protein